MIAICSGMPALQFFFSVSVIHFPLTELDMQGTVTPSDGVSAITGELQIHSQSLNTERCYYHLETFTENKTAFESGWLFPDSSDLLTVWAPFLHELLPLCREIQLCKNQNSSTFSRLCSLESSGPEPFNRACGNFASLIYSSPRMSC